MNHDPTPEYARVIADVSAERHRQISKGWTPEHDDTHTTRTMTELAGERALQGSVPFGTNAGRDLRRRRLVQAAAILVAAIESIDRRNPS